MNHDRPTKPHSLLLPRLTALVALVAVTLLVGGCGEQAGQRLTDAADEGRKQVEDIASEARNAGSSSGGPSESTHTVTVDYVVDGDTVELQQPIQGQTSVRLIGVDTPETTSGKDEPLGEEAARFTTSRLEGRRVELTLGAEARDPYDRLLAYVRLPGRDAMHQEQLLRRGLAQDLFYEPNTRYEGLFGRIQEDARQRQVGIWGLPLSQQCQLEDRGNGIGSGSAAC